MEFTDKDIERLKAKAAVKVIFWGRLIMSMKYNLTTAVPTAMVRLPDNNPGLIAECSINPEFMATLPKKQQLTILAHEVAHIIMHHPTRGQRVAKLYPGIKNLTSLIQQAADYEVNAILKAAKFEPVPGWLYDPKFHDQPFERILKDLIHNQPSQDSQQPSQPSQDSQQPSQDSQDSQDSQQPSQGSQGSQDAQDAQLDDLLDLLNDLLGTDPSDPSDSDPSDPSDPDPDPDGMGSFEVPTMTNKQAQQIEQIVNQAAMQAAVLAKQCGSAPAGMEDHFDKLLNPVLSWDEVLADFETTLTNEDYSWERPDEMLLSATSLQGSPIYMPDLYSEKIPNIVVACDTSGSVTQAELDFTASQVVHLFTELNPEEIHVLWVNVRVNNPQIFTEVPTLEQFKPVTGGGTNYIPAFEYADNLTTPPAGLVYITDGECWRFPDIAPEYPVVWILTGPRRFKPPFGKVGFVNL